MLKEKIKQSDFKTSVLGEQVARILTEAILEGVFRGGDKLVEAELQKQFGISRSPLREAFRELEKKGLVMITPRKGTFVRRITRKDIEEHFPVRAHLEGLAARIALHKMGPQSLKDLERIVVKMEQAVGKNDVRAYWQQHMAFHEIFIDASGNEVLINILNTLRMHSMWYRFSYRYYRDDLGKSLKDHQTILELFKKRPAESRKLAAQVQNHIEVASEKFLAYLETQKD